MRILCKAPRTIHRTLKTGVPVGSRNAQGRRPSPASPGSARESRQVPGDLLAQSSVKLSQATLSQATLSHATLSHATLSHATLSQATLSHATLSQAKLSQATLFQTRVSQVSRNQGMPPSVGSFQCSGEPKRTGNSARAKPSAGRSPSLAQVKPTTGWNASGRNASARNAPGRSALGTSAPSQCGTSTSSGSVVSRVAVEVAANASSSPLPSAVGSGRALPLSCPYGCVVPTRSALT